MSTMTNEQRTHRRRQLTGAVVTVGGLLVLVVAAGIAWSWRSQLPDPVASHWGLGGEPNGFSSLGSTLALLLGLGGALVLVFGATTWALGQTAVIRRIGAAATTWIVLFLSTVVVGTLAIQRGLADARDAGSADGVLLVAILGPIVPTIIAAALVPGDLRQPTTATVAADAPRVQLTEGERAAWIGRTTSHVAFLIAVPIAVLALALAVLTQLWATLIINAVVILALVTLTAFVVRVDRTGLTVRSAIGWPRYRIPLDEIVRADVTQVSPLRDFGGWGWRVGRGGRVGVVLRNGEALQVVRTGERSIVITLDDAATAAGLLNALADRAR